MKNNVSTCCSAPCKYRKGEEVKTGKEVLIPFCCKCEKQTEVQQIKLTEEQKKINKEILFRSIFPGIENFNPKKP